MDSVVRAAVVYGFLLVLLQLMGKRGLSQMNTADFVLLLVVAEVTEQAMLGNDHSLVNALLVITTLVGINIAISLIRLRFPTADKWINGAPVVLVEDGRPLGDRMRRTQVNEEDVLAAARELQGLERMEQVKFAVLESTGEITIIPKPQHPMDPGSRPPSAVGNGAAGS